jgi:hypothetical protein
MGVQSTQWIIFPPLLQYSHDGPIKLYVVQTSKHFNMVNASIAFLNGNSFKGASTNIQFFWQALCPSIALYILGLVYDLQFKV